MIALLQRVTEAAVEVDGKQIASISKGLMVLLGVEKGDDEHVAKRLIDKLVKYRVFSDAEDKMNLSLLDSQGQLLLVPQFTLAANTNKGLRPSFSSAATPSEGERLFNVAVSLAKQAVDDVKIGQFGADMKVSLINDGPVTFRLQVSTN